jgi:elongator complex protein 3
LSYEDKNESIYGFLRLRKPSIDAHRDEIDQDTCIVREIHVYGKSLKLGEKGEDEIQHSGLGKNLMREAEKISKEEFDAKKILVISAVGTREYYQKLGYSLYGPYMSNIWAIHVQDIELVKRNGRARNNRKGNLDRQVSFRIT